MRATNGLFIKFQISYNLNLDKYNFAHNYVFVFLNFVSTLHWNITLSDILFFKCLKVKCLIQLKSDKLMN